MRKLPAIASFTSAECPAYSAQLVTSVAEMIDLMTGNLPDVAFEPRDSPEVTRILDVLSSTPKSAATIATTAGMALSITERELNALEQSGRAVKLQNGWSRLT